jgi:L-ascorbate metabolism protein UlaG (beta-lactamase superfamily)
MIKPVLQDDAFLKDVAAAREDSRDLSIWWLGQSGFLLHCGGRCLLLDPYLSDSLTLKYANTDKPHVRMTERVIPPERLTFIDVITSSHNHTDHLDADTLKPLLTANPGVDLIVPEANREFVAERLGLQAGFLRGLNAGESLEAKGFKIHGIPSAHNELETDAKGRHRYLGYVVEADSFRIYHSGDTKLYEGMADLLRPWKLDVALLPINGDRPERRVAGNLDGREAALLARDIAAKLVIPCHYNMFEFNTASPDEFVATANKLRQSYRVLQCGELCKVKKVS